MKFNAIIQRKACMELEAYTTSPKDDRKDMSLSAPFGIQNSYGWWQYIIRHMGGHR